MQNMQDGRPVIVSEAVMRPNHCALAPQISRDPEGFIDTGVKLPGVAPRVYVSMSAFRDLARRLGWTAPDEAEAVDELLAEANAREKTLETRIEQLEQQLAAVEILKAAGYTEPAKPAARPRKTAQKAAA